MTAAAELERYGVRVNAIAPVAATRLTAWAGDQPAMAPELVAPLVVWLCAPVSAGVTGRVFEVGAGAVNLLDGWRRAVAIRHDAGTSPAELGEMVSEALPRLDEPVPATVPVSQAAP